MRRKRISLCQSRARDPPSPGVSGGEIITTRRVVGVSFFLSIAIAASLPTNDFNRWSA